MTDSKQKKPMSSLDYIKNQPHLQGKPLTIQNQYSALAEYPPLSYSKAVAPDKGQPSQPTNEPIAKATYYLKPYKQHLMTTHYIEPIKLKELQQFVNRTFYQDALYPTDNITKNRTFYEYILVDSKSIEVTHYPDKTNPNLISYSTCKILRIASINDLGLLHLHTTRPFSQPGFPIPGYSYIDYENAWKRFLYLRPYDHSWFISFDQKFPKQVPGWFNEWWYWFGPSDQIYPSDVLNISLPFYSKHITQKALGPYHKILFHADMGIPWICSWHFNLSIVLPNMPYSLIKEFRVKWWDKYNLDRCSLANINKFLHTHKMDRLMVKSISKTIPLLPPDQNPTQKIPKPTTQNPQPRPATPTKSASSSSSQQNKKKKLAEALKTLSNELLHISDDDDTDNDEVMCLTTQDSLDPFGGPLGQDPFDF